jgi:predicted transcriptional regulator
VSRGSGHAPTRWYHGDTISGMALTLRTDDELEKALTALAAVEGTSRQEVIRRAVLERYERSGHAARVQESSARLIEQWGDVLHRLGTV